MQRLTGADATFLYAETPRAPMEVATCMVLDAASLPRGEAALELVREHLRQRLHLAPVLRRRLVRVPFELDHPVWIEDPHFDLEYHLRHLALPAPGSLTQLSDVLARLVSRPLDRSRPLWELYLVEGLEGDRAAIYVKAHHAAIDGIAGFELLSALIDLEPEPGPPPPPEHEWAPDREPSDLRLVAGATADLVRQPLRGLRAAGRLLGGAVRLQRGHANPVGVLGATTAPATPFNRQLTPHRRLRFLEMDLATIESMKDAAGVKLNDVMLAVVGGGLRRYLERDGTLPDRPLVAFVPVTLRTDGAQGANLTTVMYVELATDEPEPRRRLERIAAASRTAKDLLAETGPPAITDFTELTGPTLGALTGRLLVAGRVNERIRFGGNVVVSNIPGIPVPLYAHGARVDQLFPIGPITDGTGLNITLLTYCDRLEICLTADREALARPDDLVADLRAAHDELHATLTADRVDDPAPAGRPAGRPRSRRAARGQ